MPRENRVTPLGDRIAVPARGTLLGNRGCLVDAEGRFTGRRWTTWAWIACRLEFKGRRRPLMQPGTWTELFFLDEATALAAGHRPCGECRRADFLRFKQCWLAANAARLPDGPVTVAAIDRILQGERAPRWRGLPWPELPWASLPDGAMVLLEDEPWLLAQGRLLRWTPEGYRDPRPRNVRERGDAPVRAITPLSIIGAIRAGYTPALHASAGGA